MNTSLARILTTLDSQQQYDTISESSSHNINSTSDVPTTTATSHQVWPPVRERPQSFRSSNNNTISTVSSSTRYQHQHQQQYQSDYLKFHRLPCIQHINLLLYNIPLHRGEDTIHQHHHQCHSPKTPISHSHLQSFNHLHHALSKRNFHFVLSNQRTPNHRTSPNSKIKLQSTIIGRSGASSHLHRPGTHYWLPEMQLVSHSTSKCHHSNKGPYSSSHQVPYLRLSHSLLFPLHNYYRPME